MQGWLRGLLLYVVLILSALAKEDEWNFANALSDSMVLQAQILKVFSV